MVEMHAEEVQPKPACTGRAGKARPARLQIRFRPTRKSRARPVTPALRAKRAVVQTHSVLR
jgi:hypothetical protein